MRGSAAPSTAFETATGVSLLAPGRNCMAVAEARRAAVLVGAEAYHRAFVQAAERANHSIVIIGWDFDPGTRLMWHGRRRRRPVLVGDLLNDLVRRRRDLRIYILAWDYSLIYGGDHGLQPLYSAGWKPGRHIEQHYDATAPLGSSHHQRLVVIDGEVAFCGGLDFTCRRWAADAAAPVRESAKRRRKAMPAQDAMAMVDGAAAHALAQVAYSRWRDATGHEIPAVEAASVPWPATVKCDLTSATVGIARTVAASETPAGAREVDALHLDLIAAARHTLYIETPYFTSARIADALSARLEEEDGPEVIIVTREQQRGWLERSSVDALRTHALQTLARADRHGRMRAYHLDGGAPSGCSQECQSNVLVVDDAWLCIGSANATSRSLSIDSECDVIFEAGAEDSVRAAIAALRNGLVARHLGTDIERVALLVRKTGSLRAAMGKLLREARGLAPLPVDPGSAQAAPHRPSEPESPVPLDELIEQFAPDTSVPDDGPAWGRIALIALVLVALGATWRYTPLSQIVTPEYAIEWARSIGRAGWAPLVVMLAYTPASFLMFPRPLITLFAVIAFGSWLGFAYAIGGIILAALVTYCAGRALPRDTIRNIAGEKLNGVSEVLRRRGLLAVLAVRIVPVAPFVVVNMVAGAVHIRLWHYVVGTLLGMLPGTLMMTIFSDQLAAALEDPARIDYGIVAAVVLFFAVVIMLVRRWFAREQLAHQQLGSS